MKVMNKRQAKKLGTYIAKHRKAQGISGRGLAAAVEVQPSTMLRIERGEYQSPGRDKLVAVAKALDLDIANVLLMAGYEPDELPDITPYMRTKFKGLPEDAAEQIEKYAMRIAKKHGIDTSGPADGQDEKP